MGTKIADVNGGGNFVPTARLKEAGASLLGTLEGKRQVKTMYGDKPVYSMKIEDADAKFEQDGKLVEPAVGDTIDFFAPTRLERQLVQVTMGKKISIKYAGTKKVGKGQPAHVFDVEVF